jgi:hypothetical protein
LDGASLRVRRPSGRKRVQMLVAYASLTLNKDLSYRAGTSQFIV